MPSITIKSGHETPEPVICGAMSLVRSSKNVGAKIDAQLLRLKKIIVTQSLISLFDQCPRKYAESLGQAEALGEDFHDVGIPNKYALWGTMFHLAISNMYQQIIDTNS